MIGIEEALREKVPDEALDYCCKLWIDFPLDLSLLHPGKAVTLLSEFLERIYPIGG